jgi:hypothetical protein
MAKSKSKTSAIDDKKVEHGKSSKPSENNWGGFISSLISSFIFILIIGIIGANFIYLSDTSKEGLIYLMPDDIKYYFKTDATKTGGGNGFMAYTTDNDSDEIIKKLNLLGIPGDKKIGESFPYNGYAENLASDSFTGDISNWIKHTVASSFATSRSIFIKYLTVTSSIFPRTLLMFIIAPLTLLLSIILIILTFSVSFFSAFSSGWVYALIGIFFGYTFLFSIALSFSQLFRFLFTLLILPLYMDMGEIRNILGEFTLPLLIVFGALVCNSAFANLDMTISITMTCIFIFYIFLHFYHCWKNNGKC